MPSTSGFLSEELGNQHIESIKQRCIRWAVPEGKEIFSEGDNADSIYFIESGKVDISIQKFTKQETVCALGPGEFFGEMAFFTGDKRSATATAAADSLLLSIDKASFYDLLHSDEGIARKMSEILAERSEQLAAKENVFDSFCSDVGTFHLGIKGDPSLRESAFTRERYQSVVDQLLPSLRGTLYDLLVNRTVCEFVIHFNSGEVQIRTILDPFSDEIHPVNKLLNKAYVERHFPPIKYEEKMAVIRRQYDSLRTDQRLQNLPAPVMASVEQHHDTWQPITLAEAAQTLSKLVQLRRIPNFYLRNFTISVGKHAIRMQFNCDGTHLLSTDGLSEFLEQNVQDEEDYVAVHPDRRQHQRRARASHEKGVYAADRRTPPGRRREDWDAMNASLPG